ncbi:hypothetical protein V6N13_060442 [Hibiscus sabdariffa]
MAEMNGSISSAELESSVIHISSSISHQVKVLSVDPRNIDCFDARNKSLRARYVYSVIFFVTNLTAWFIRDYGHSVFPPLYYTEACGISGHDCFHALGVLRIFFLLMFLTTFTARKLYEAYSKWHSGWWGLKLVLLLISMVVPFFLPPDFIHIYGEVARVGAGLIKVSYLQELWLLMLFSSVGLPLEGLKKLTKELTFGLTTLLFSEPADEKCNIQKPDNGHFDWTTILGFLIAVGAIVMATFSTGIDSKSFQFSKTEVKLEDDIRYNYGFFHMIFSLGAMYFAMLFISWNLEDSANEWSIDVGWASACVKIINEWLAATIYMWKLIGPVVKKPKVNDEESMQP